jgi:hypothetical protein
MVSQHDQGDGDTGPAEVGGNHHAPAGQAVHHDAGHEAEHQHRDDLEYNRARDP